MDETTVVVGAPLSVDDEHPTSSTATTNPATTRPTGGSVAPPAVDGGPGPWSAVPMGAGASPEPPRQRSVSISLDLGAPARAVRRLVPRPVRSAVSGAGRVADRLESGVGPREQPAGDVIHGCSVPCPATVVGLAELQAQRTLSDVWHRVLIRLAVERPDGTVEVCLRHLVPTALHATIGPGTTLPALADPGDRTRAVVRWDVPPGAFWERAHLAFPPPEE